MRCPERFSAASDAVNRSQKSEKRGRSTALRASGVAASTEQYSCVMGTSAEMASGNCALVTRKVEMRLACSNPTSSLIFGYLRWMARARALDLDTSGADLTIRT